MKLLGKYELIEVHRNEGKGIRKNYGQRYFSGAIDNGRECLDLELIGYKTTGGRERVYIEVKTKSYAGAWHPENPEADWHDERWEYRTGIDLQKWHSYSDSWQKVNDSAHYLLFIQALNGAQFRRQGAHARRDIAGIYVAEISELQDLLVHGSGEMRSNMVYWPLRDLKQLYSFEELLCSNAANEWSAVRKEAAKQKSVRLLDMHANT